MTPPTTPIPPCAECGPSRWVQGELVCDGKWTKRDIERGWWRSDKSFTCQRCGTVHVLRDGKLVREEYLQADNDANAAFIDADREESQQPETEREVKIPCATIPPCSQAIHSTVNAMSVPVASPAPVQSKPESGATPGGTGILIPFMQRIKNLTKQLTAECVAREAAEESHKHTLDDFSALKKWFNTAQEEKDQLHQQLAMANDAAQKGDAARLAAAGMEIEIDRLKAELAEAEKRLAELDAWIANGALGETEQKP